MYGSSTGNLLRDDGNIGIREALRTVVRCRIHVHLSVHGLFTLGYGSSYLVALMSIAMVLSQLLSAILLRDLSQDFVRGPRFTDTHYHLVEKLVDVAPLEPLAQRPLLFPRFAEQTGRSISFFDNSTGRGLYDTGTTLRAYPELKGSNRSSLLYYHGPGAVMEAHVLCVSPDLDELTYDGRDRVTGRLSSAYLYDSISRLESEGSYRWNGAQPASDLVFDFNCTLGDFLGRMLCPLRPPVAYDCPGFPTQCLLASTNAWFLMIDESGSAWREEGNNPSPKNDELTRQLYNITGYDFDGSEWIGKTVHWNSSDDGLYGPDYSVWMSLCVVATGNFLSIIEAKADWRADEPLYGSEWNDTWSPVKDILTQLSNDPKLKDRGIMNLTTPKAEAHRNFTQVLQNIRGGYGSYLTHDGSDNDFYDNSLKLEQLETVYNWMLSEHWDDDENSSIAFGLQSIFTLVTSQAFYNMGPDRYNAKNKANVAKQKVTLTMQLAVAVQVPTQKMGLFITSGIVGLHMVSVVIIFWLYFTCRAPKFLDQAWQIVEQLHRGQAKILDEVGNRSDLEVARLPAAEKLWGKVVEITPGSGIAVEDADTEPLLRPVLLMEDLENDSTCIQQKPAGQAITNEVHVTG